ncbi:MAG: hypothetical protein WKF77_25625 [Planctomycetaceae bacterium]
MAWFEYYWSEKAIDKVAQHGLTQDDFEFAFENHYREELSPSSDRHVRVGATADGRRIAVAFEWVQEDLSVIPVTAYEV